MPAFTSQRKLATRKKAKLATVLREQQALKDFAAEIIWDVVHGTLDLSSPRN